MKLQHVIKEEVKYWDKNGKPVKYKPSLPSELKKLFHTYKVKFHDSDIEELNDYMVNSMSRGNSASDAWNDFIGEKYPLSNSLESLDEDQMEYVELLVINVAHRDYSKRKNLYTYDPHGAGRY